MTEPTLGNRAARLIHDAMTAHCQACEEACRRCVATFGFLPTETREHVDAGGILLEIERAERERVLVELLFLPGGWRMEASATGAMNGPRHRSDALRMCAQDIEVFIAALRARA